MKKLLFMLTVLATLFSLISCADGAINWQKLDFYPASNNSYVVSVGDAKHLDEIVIPKIYFGKPVVEIEENGFRNCERLERITIPNSITSIGSMAFEGCQKLKNVEIRDGVTSIDQSAFYGCKSLESIVIPKSVTSIGERAFYGNGSFISIKYRGTEEEWNSINKENNWIYRYDIIYNYDGE